MSGKWPRLPRCLAPVPLTDPDGVVQVKYKHSTRERHAHFEFMAGLTTHTLNASLWKGPLGILDLAGGWYTGLRWFLLHNWGVGILATTAHSNIFHDSWCHERDLNHYSYNIYSTSEGQTIVNEKEGSLIAAENKVDYFKSSTGYSKFTLMGRRLNWSSYRKLGW